MSEVLLEAASVASFLEEPSFVIPSCGPSSICERLAPASIEDVHDRDVGLKGGCVETGQPHIPEQRSGHQEIGGGAPVALDVESGRGIFLPAIDLECDAGAETPV